MSEILSHQTHTNSYTLGEDEKASKRLDIQHEILGNDLKNQLLEVGLKKGDIVLEIGCGNGLMAFWTASQIGEVGKVIAVDKSLKHIETARHRAHFLGITNIEFMCCDIKDLVLDLNSVDIIYCRFLLMHVRHPLDSIKNMISFLKVGGAFVAQEPINSNTYIHPQNTIFINTLTDFLSNISLNYGVDYDIGKNMYKLFCQAGLHNINLHLSQRMLSIDLMKSFLVQFYEDIRPAALKAGIISDFEVSKQIEIIRLYSEKEYEYYVLPQQAHVTGYRL